MSPNTQFNRTSGAAYKHQALVNWPFSRADRTGTLGPETASCPYTNTRRKMLGVYSFGHLKEIQANQNPTEYNSRQPLYGYPLSVKKTDGMPPKNMTTHTVSNRDVELLWQRNEPKHGDEDGTGTTQTVRPSSAHPASRRKEPELEFLAPVPRHQRPSSARQPRSYYHHQGLRAPSLSALATATRKEFLHNKIQGRKGSICFGTED
mmetsp:Transcript_29288/g.63988  ORF Transcript_29288/g.63988 Transcript_29288/m.63988 type:complete len:206 (-) Transcript_29288:134-751(-)